MKFSVTIGGSKKTRQSIAGYARKINQTTEDAVQDLGLAVQLQARYLIENSPATGVIYYRQNPTRVHRASAEGEPPADDLGNLVRSIVVREVKINQYAYSSVVGSSLPYALELEKFGPNHNGETRPFLRPAVVLVEARAKAIIASAWNKNRV